jgi:uncharacterized protein (DUF1778 family)
MQVKLDLRNATGAKNLLKNSHNLTGRSIFAFYINSNFTSKRFVLDQRTFLKIKKPAPKEVVAKLKRAGSSTENQ